MEKEHIEHWLAVNDQGDRMTSFDGPEDAVAALIDKHGGAAFRTVKFSTLMDLPTAVEADPIIEITAEDGDETTIEIEEEDEGLDDPAEGDKDRSPVKEPGAEAAVVTA